MSWHTPANTAGAQGQLSAPAVQQSPASACGGCGGSGAGPGAASCSAIVVARMTGGSTLPWRIATMCISTCPSTDAITPAVTTQPTPSSPSRRRWAPVAAHPPRSAGRRSASRLRPKGHGTGRSASICPKSPPRLSERRLSDLSLYGSLGLGGHSRCVAAALWAGWPPDRVAAAKISNALDTLVGTNEALAASSPVDSGGHGRAHAAAMLAERQGAGIGGLDPGQLVLRRRSSADNWRSILFPQEENVKLDVSASM